MSKIYEIRYRKNTLLYKCAVCAISFKDAVSKIPNLDEADVVGFKVIS